MEKIKSLFKFWVHNVDDIIIWILVALLTLSCFVIYLAFFGKRKSSSGILAEDSDQLSQLEETIKKLLAQAPSIGVPGGAVAAAASGGDENGGGGGNAAAEKLKQEIEQKDAELKVLKEKVQTQSKGGADASEIAAFKAKIEELEGKLAEYEIIEDDIADLSRYKDENQRLRAELDQLRSLTSSKSSGSAALADASEESEDPLMDEFESIVQGTEEGDVADDPLAALASEADGLSEGPPTENSNPAVAESPDVEEVDDLAAAVAAVNSAVEEMTDGDVEDEIETFLSDESEQSSVSATGAITTDEEGDPVGDDILAEFAGSTEEAAVEQNTEVDNGESPIEELAAELANEVEPVKEVTNKAPAEPTVAAKTEKKKSSAGDLPSDVEDKVISEEVVNEFAEALGEKGLGDELEASSIDTSKMLEEMDNLAEGIEASDGTNALEEEPDVDKMAKEAKKLASME